jgi:cytochrome c oxidase cbb3-type subunit III
MSTAHDQEIDAHTGTTTPGQEWDGIRELNTPLPKWWLYIFYATIVWSFGYFIVYPSWPLLSSYTPGVSGWTSRGAVTADLESLQKQRAPMMTALAAAPLADIARDDKMRGFAVAAGRAAFGDNCAPCHGAGGGGSPSFPNLNDDEWIWGGSLEDIQHTIAYGIRSGHEKTRLGSPMPAFGLTGMLKPAEISQLADHTRAMAGLPTEKSYDAAAAGKLFQENCASCHGDDGKGNQEFGAPNLTDKIWLFGSDKATIAEGIIRGRASVMPGWIGRLDDTTIKALTVYVHGLGGGK